MSIDRPVVEVGQPAHGGHCVARLDGDGPVVFVRHALPGERVAVEVTERRRRFWRADAVNVLEASPDRVPSAWPEAGPGGVGGGELAHVALSAQREWKRTVLAGTLRRIGGERIAEDVAELEASGAAGVPPVEALPGDDARAGLAARTRIELTVDPAGRAGMYRYRSHEVLALAEMPLAHEALTGLGLLGEGSAWRRLWRPGSRVEAVAPSDPAAPEPLVLVDGETASRRRKGAAPVRRAVRETVASPVGELHYRVTGSGFWQVHREAPTTLVTEVLAAVSPEGPGGLEGAHVLELYSGAGLLTLPLARATGERGAVAAVEGDARAVRDARRNLHDQPWAALGQGSIDAPAVAEAGAGMLNGRVDAVVLDPPRAGAGAEVMSAVTALGADRIVLVACDPAALARDLAVAAEGGYRVARLRPLDLFPHTHHLEVVATLIRSRL